MARNAIHEHETTIEPIYTKWKEVAGYFKEIFPFSRRRYSPFFTLNGRNTKILFFYLSVSYLATASPPLGPAPSPPPARTTRRRNTPISAWRSGLGSQCSRPRPSWTNNKHTIWHQWMDSRIIWNIHVASPVNVPLVLAALLPQVKGALRTILFLKKLDKLEVRPEKWKLPCTRSPPRTRLLSKLAWCAKGYKRVIF